MSADLYKEAILDHFRHPRNRGDLPDANAQARDTNILCGDVIEMQLRIDHGRIEDVKFRGEGCAISQATASMLTEFSKGKTLSEMTSLQREGIVALIGTDPGPARIECALLGLRVLKQAICAYEGKDVSGGTDAA
jgi:nitrogen fixation NifU-like protein